MNAPVAPSLFGSVDLAPRDPILGVSEAFAAETNPGKVNLGVGVYVDDDGKVPVLVCVRQAEATIAAQHAPRSYLPIDGIPAYDKAAKVMVLGADNPIIAAGRSVTVQALGGTGALKVGADFLKRFAPGAGVWISDPSWENHRALFEQAGFPVSNYPYYNPVSRNLDIEGMIGTLEKLAPGSIVVLHACCHNPTGVDPSREQWKRILDTVRGRGLVPFLDFAYQGFGDGIDADATVVHAFAATPGPLFISSSFSKSFSLYGERVGALTVVTDTPDEAQRVLSQLKRVVRANYSNPPTFGGRTVSTILESPDLRALWEKELGGMRDRIKAMRHGLADRLSAAKPGRDFSYMTRQRGMFSYSGLSKEAVATLRRDHAIYMLDTGRICVAALNSKNLDKVAAAVAQVI